MRFAITWLKKSPGTGGEYKVSVPNYGGGEVVTVDEFDALEAENERLRAALADAIRCVTGPVRHAGAPIYTPQVSVSIVDRWHSALRPSHNQPEEGTA